MTDEGNLFDPMLNRSPAEIGREVRRPAKRHGAVSLEIGEHEWDVAIYPAEDDGE